MTFEQFFDEAIGEGLSDIEAIELWETLEEQGFDPTSLDDEQPYDDSYDEPYDVGETESLYDLDDSWPDDEWLDAGEEWEMTAETLDYVGE